MSWVAFVAACLALGACADDAPMRSGGAADARLATDGAPPDAARPDGAPARDGAATDAQPRDGALPGDAARRADAATDASASDASPPDASRADAATDAAAPDASRADAATDATAPDASRADAATDATAPDVVRADASPPDASGADASPADATPPDACVPACAGRTCGDDGCRGLCGRCAPNEACIGGACVCQPRCDGVCGDDGCGGSCGACPGGHVCVDGACACDPRLPDAWPARWAPSDRNPLLVASADAALQGADNVYAPDIVPHAGGWLLWYGSQGADGHDRIFLATSRDGMEWRKWPEGADPQPVLNRGAANHQNDPSVVRVGDRWRMYYTEAPRAEEDLVALATAASPDNFQREGYVLQTGPAGAWDSVKVGRPSVLYEDGLYRLWYDGTGPDGRRHVGLAVSNDGVRFVRHPGNPVFRDAGAVDVKRVGGVYVMLREGGDGTRWATSPDGLCWVDRGLLFARSGAAYDAHGQVTPFLWLAEGRAAGVYFGGAFVPAWNRNRIAAAFPGGAAPAPGGGCTGCLEPGLTCGEACPGDGICGAPGSADPGRCCACAPSGCEACLGAQPDCHAACLAAGHVGGWCAHPGSRDPAACCACFE